MTTPSSATPRKKPLASGTLLTPIGTGTCRSDNETATSFCTLYPVRSIRTCRARSARIPASFRHWFYPDTDPVFSVFHPAERLNMIPSSAPPFFQIHKSHGIGYGMNSIGTAIKKLGVICGFLMAGAKRDLSGSGGSVPFSGNDPQPIRSINTVSVPPLFRR